ncbi:metalloendopeptidase, glycoprotease family [Zymomonas mobilis subsp. pomaceae ATCC 29192]|uniref:tRNA N6-adenosine threonylcarbamoyltransferase n=2 Tax=Zymomonas mobilis TaxID=542 RepID=F8EU91_ZYMMT|nr:metalloendopeptidase, glycoprotease family [Zymomonas mobilis subsp. pomaceae ATCC 29192]
MMAEKPPMALVLGLESSCDETAVALVDNNGNIISHHLATQEILHRPYGGVVPEIAARAHVERLEPLIRKVLNESDKNLTDIDAIAATAGPGLIGGVMVGLVTGKALSLACNKPLIAVNHLEGHALTPRLANQSLNFPYLLLLISGGHCQILLVQNVGVYRRLATTIDDAGGEAFDKTAKILGLGFPGGPAVEQEALKGDPHAVPLPRPLIHSQEPHFSFAGLKTAVLRAHQSGQYKRADIAASFQQAVIDCLVNRSQKALKKIEGEGISVNAFVIAGGMAANTAIRPALIKLAEEHHLPLVAPPPWLCTDNGAMIAWAGLERFRLGMIDGLDIPAKARWPLDPYAEKARGAGVKA